MIVRVSTYYIPSSCSPEGHLRPASNHFNIFSEHHITMPINSIENAIRRISNVDTSETINLQANDSVVYPDNCPISYPTQ